MKDVIIASAVRTAIGKAPRGALRATRPDDLAALVIKEALAQTASTLRRFTPKARGSAGPILKRNCHIKIVLSDE